jgi:hypothetical protein
MERLCGNCAYGGAAYDRFGHQDENYVICQIKELENLNRKPDRFSTLSAVSRMHIHREACVNWKPLDEPHTSPWFEFGPPTASTAAVAPPSDPDYDLIRPAQVTRGPAPDNQEEVKKLKLQLIQKEQMIQSLQTQNVFLSEQLDAARRELEDSRAAASQIRYFDPTALARMDFFTLLGVTRESRHEQIKEAYRSKMKFYHPDRFAAIARLINEAYETLTNPAARTKYLQKLRADKTVE